MACEKYTIDSNVAGLSYAEESCIGKLPDAVADSGAQDGGVWYPLEPNEYDDLGGEITTEARTPISASRQRQKGTTVDLEADGGFNQDVTFLGLQRLLQGFCYSDARERPSNAPLNGQAASTIEVVELTATGATIEVGTGEGAKFAVGQILKLSGFANPGNNGTRVITSISTDVLSVSGTLVDETPAGDDFRLQVVGYKFGDSVAGITFDGNEVLLLTRSSGDFTTEGFNEGEWIYLGGGASGSAFDNNGGYARIHSIAAGSLRLIEPTWVPVTEAGESGDEIELYFGTFIRNEKTQSLIKRRTYQLERTLGQDEDGVQSEYLVGAVPNELSINFTAAEKMTFDASFVAQTNETRTGDEGVKAGTRKELVSEEAYNAANDVYQLRLFVKDPLKASPKSLYAKVLEATLTINNGAEGLKAIGDLGSFDMNQGDFEVGGELEAYFSTIAAVRAIKNNADVGFNCICAKKNQGFVYDVPLLSLGGGRVNVEKDEPIMLPLENMGAENEYGFTLGCTYFNYLPNSAMAEIA